MLIQKINNIYEYYLFIKIKYTLKASNIASILFIYLLFFNLERQRTKLIKVQGRKNNQPGSQMRVGRQVRVGASFHLAIYLSFVQFTLEFYFLITFYWINLQ
jgi:hypothetical protein